MTTLQLGQTTAVDVMLEVGGIEEAVDVRAAAPAVDVRSSAASSNLSPEILER